MAEKKRLGRVKELSEITGPTPPAEIGEPATESEGGPSPPDTAAAFEQAASSDATPPFAASPCELEPQDLATVDGEAEDRLLTLELPAAILLQLEERARRDDASLRVVLLQALAAAGYRVGRQEPVRRPRRPALAYSNLVRAIVLFSLLSR
jgi:hypothetical protein